MSRERRGKRRLRLAACELGPSEATLTLSGKGQNKSRAAFTERTNGRRAGARRAGNMRECMHMIALWAQGGWQIGVCAREGNASTVSGVVACRRSVGLSTSLLGASKSGTMAFPCPTRVRDRAPLNAAAVARALPGWRSRSRRRWGAASLASGSRARSGQTELRERAGERTIIRGNGLGMQS